MQGVTREGFDKARILNAYEKSSECFDSILFQCDLEENGIKRMKLLEDGLESFKKSIKKRKIF